MNRLDIILRSVNAVLLAIVVILLLLILMAMPRPTPTSGEFANAVKRGDANAVARLSASLPRVAVEGAVEVFSDSEDPLVIQTDPIGGHPLNIEQPIEIRIVKEE